MIFKFTFAIFTALLILLWQLAPVSYAAQPVGMAESKPAPAAPDLSQGLFAELEKDTLSNGSPRTVLKNGNTILVLNKQGMVEDGKNSPYGLYEDDTRYLSSWQMSVNGKKAPFLCSFSQKGYRASFLYSVNDELFIEREIVVLNGVSERVNLRNFSAKGQKVELVFAHDSDFKDMFEVRGQKRLKSGQHTGKFLETIVGESSKFKSSYLGIDKKEYACYLTTKSKAARNSAGKLAYVFELAPQEAKSVEFRIETSNNAISDRNNSEQSNSGQLNSGQSDLDRSNSGQLNSGQSDLDRSNSDRSNSGQLNSGQSDLDRSNSGRPNSGQSDLDRSKLEQLSSEQLNSNQASELNFESISKLADADFRQWRQKAPTIKSDWPALDDFLEQSFYDLYILRQNTPKGPCIAAGLPWYASAFGRDQCITSMQTLSFMPEISRDVLKVLAAYQGKKSDPFTEEEPGRIMHELRLGEMARCKEIAFIPYYGTVDATPLFLVLLTRYFEATKDTALLNELWPHCEAALLYLDKSVVSNQNGFLHYGGKAGAALSNQGWKDSGDSIMHKNGSLAKAPIALCEVQGYLYEAYTGTARLAQKLGKEELAAKLLGKAERLKAEFKKSFWLGEEKFVALALDADGRACTVISSNPGHLLASGILDQEMSDAVVKRLMQEDMYSGWGIRTLSSAELKYNPMSYHNGSVWPHDNAIIMEGFAKQGYSKYASELMESLIQSVEAYPERRLPELFCGFRRSNFERPVPYPVSCSPQAWAAGSIFQMLQSSLGLKLIDRKITVDEPQLPLKMNYLKIGNLESDGKKISLEFKRDVGGKIQLGLKSELANPH